MYLIKSIFIFLSFSSVFYCFSEEIKNEESIDNKSVGKKELSKVQAILNEIKPNLDMAKKAEQLKAYSKSPEYIERQSRYEKSISNFIGIETNNNEDLIELIDTDQLILFVSSSMPIETLRRYAKQVNKVGGLMVFRGTLGDGTYILPTMKFFHNVLKKDERCEGVSCDIIGTYLTVDPRLFRVNSIQKVPALVFSEDLNLLNYASDKENDHSFPSASDFVVYGDATLLGMVREIHRQTKNDKLKTYIRKLTVK